MSRREDGVFTIEAGEWLVFFDGEVQSPSFNSKGAAQAMLDGLKAGTRKPEFRRQPTVAEFLREFYDGRWTRLTPDQQQVLVLDVVAVMEYEQLMSARRAIALLDQRIGNQLESYVLTLLLGQRRRGEKL